MKINALRRELNSLIAPEDGERKAAVRRSLRAEWIYATDLPETVGEERLEAVRARLRGAGWESETEGGWMQLRKAAEEPPEGWYDGPYGPEAGCCRSLLRRHAERRKEPDGRIEYALIRAGEEGQEQYEAVCRRLHGEWAERLRKGKALPDVSMRYFGEGYMEEKRGVKNHVNQTHRACGVLDGDGERDPDRDGSL